MKKEEPKIEISDVDGLSKAMQEKLISQGLETAEEVLDAGIEELVEIPGIGKKTAEKIVNLLNTFYEE